jgi:hypothetical protein
MRPTSRMSAFSCTALTNAAPSFGSGNAPGGTGTLSTCCPEELPVLLPPGILATCSSAEFSFETQAAAAHASWVVLAAAGGAGAGAWEVPCASTDAACARIRFGDAPRGLAVFADLSAEPFACVTSLPLVSCQVSPCEASPCKASPCVMRFVVLISVFDPVRYGLLGGQRSIRARGRSRRRGVRVLRARDSWCVGAAVEKTVHAQAQHHAGHDLGVPAAERGAGHGAAGAWSPRVS